MIITREYDGTFFIVHDNQSVTPINEQAYNAINEQNKQLQQYKSIVKAVDPDNLPEGEVLLFESNDFINSGVLENTSDGILLSGRWGNIEFFDLNITHYIETKDIIKLLG